MFLLACNHVIKNHVIQTPPLVFVLEKDAHRLQGRHIYSRMLQQLCLLRWLAVFYFEYGI